MDPTDPPARQQSIIEQCRAALVISEQSARGPSAAGGEGGGARDGEVNRVDAADFFARPRARPATASTIPDPSDTLCLVQTTGSTAEAQGVTFSHRTVLHHIDNFRSSLNITHRDRISLLASPKFGAANSATYGALLSGACLCPYAVKARPFSDLLAWLRHERITVLHTTPSLFRMLARQMEGTSLPYLRAIKLGGEPAYRADADLFRARFSKCCLLVNGLGMSEVGGNVSHFVVTHNNALPDEETIPVGMPLPGTALRVVDDEGRSVAVGIEGEIAVRSDFLANVGWQSSRCAMGNNEIRTGDRGKILADGNLVHLGRKDRIIKLRGLRIDLNLIEATLLQSSAVKNAHVAQIDGGLTAYIEQVPENADRELLRRYLAKVLPDYMIPQRFICLDKMPLTANGKVDRQRLRALELPVEASMVVSPRNPLEERLARAWSAILGTDSIGMYDNFFARGGDSLKGLELIARLSRELGRKLPVALLINHPSIAQMAEALAAGFVQSPLAPLLRRLQVALLPMRSGGTRPPLVFIPGGYTSENELLVCAGLLPHLPAEHPVFGVRLDLQARRVLPPWSIAALARRIVRLLADRLQSVPIVVGECHACPLAFETAQQIASRTKQPPQLILLDPLTPRSGASVGASQHSFAMRRYAKLLRNYRPSEYQGEVHVIRCAESAALGVATPWHTVSPHLHVVPGDHQTYIRRERDKLAATLTRILNVS